MNKSWEDFDPCVYEYGLGYESGCACGCGHRHGHGDEPVYEFVYESDHEPGFVYELESEQGLGYGYESVCDCGCGHEHGAGYERECDCGSDCDCESNCDCGFHGGCDCEHDAESIPEPPLAEFEYERDGLSYHVRRWGVPGEIPLVMLHGFMQTGATWAHVARRLARHHCLYALDLIGHGKSGKPASDASYTLAAQSDAVAAFIQEVVAPENAAATPVGNLVVRRAHVLGYSMGGRIALDVALRHHDVVYTLILESAGMGPADEEERTQLAKRAQEWVDRLHSDGMEAFVGHWEDMPLFQTQQRLRPELRDAIRAERVANDAEAMARVVLNAGSQTMDAARDNMAMLGQLWLPTLYVAGTRDEKHLEIAERFIHEGFDAKPVMAGHDTHLEMPAEFCKAVESFLRANELRGV